MQRGLFSFLEKVAYLQAEPQHHEFLDEHFSISPQWASFRKKLRSKSFVSAVKQDTRSDDKLKRFSEANGMHLQAKGVPTFKVQGESQKTPYMIKYHPESERFSCSCPDWHYKRSWQERRPNKDCKHIAKIKAELKTEGKEEKDLTKTAALGRAALHLLKTTALAK